MTQPRADRRLLPEGFPFDEGYEWRRKVQFGEANRRAVEASLAKEKEVLAKEAIAQDMGFADADTLERAQQFATLPQGEQERLLAESRRRQSHELPRHEPRDPDRSARQEAANAPMKTVEERTRSVSVGRDDIKKLAVHDGDARPARWFGAGRQWQIVWRSWWATPTLRVRRMLARPRDGRGVCC